MTVKQWCDHAASLAAKGKSKILALDLDTTVVTVVTVTPIVAEFEVQKDDEGMPTEKRRIKSIYGQQI